MQDILDVDPNRVLATDCGNGRGSESCCVHEVWDHTGRKEMEFLVGFQGSTPDAVQCYLVYV